MELWERKHLLNLPVMVSAHVLNLVFCVEVNFNLVYKTNPCSLTHKMLKMIVMVIKAQTFIYQYVWTNFLKILQLIFDYTFLAHPVQ